VSPTWSVPQWRKHFDKRIEKRMLKRAAAAVFTTGETAEAYRSAFEGLPRGGGLHVSRCAFDPASFEDLKSAGKSAGKFRLVYTGIYGMVNRNIQGLLDSLAGLERDDWELHLAGVDNSENENSLAGYLSQLGIDAQVHQHGQLPLAEALSLQKSADLLLLWGWPGGMQIPAKVYEYIAVERPIMLIRGDVHDASESLVREGPRGISVAADRDFLSKALNTILEDWSTGRWEAQFNLKRDMRFSWDAQISILADIFESVNRAD
jgi:hypothetical protein